MYTMQVDGNTFYSPYATDSGFGVINPKITYSQNQPSYLSFTLPSTNQYYNSFNPLRSIVKVFRDNKEIFRGRVLYSNTDFFLRKEIYVEDELAYLKDTICTPNHFKGSISQVLGNFLNEHNRHVKNNNPYFPINAPIDTSFTLGNVTVTIPSGYNQEVEYAEPKYYNNMFDVIKSTLLDNYGGYLKVRYDNGVRYLDYLKESGTENTQTIAFRENLLDLTEYISAENLFTCLIPLGKEDGDDVVNIKDSKKYNPPEIYMYNREAVQLFGKIFRTNSWGEVTDPDKLYELGVEYLNKSLNMAISITLKAVDLSLIDVNYEEFKIGDKVRVISLPHGIDSNSFTCSTLVLDLVQPDQSEYTFGYSFNAMTSAQIDEVKMLKEKVNVTKTLANTAKEAADQAQETADQAQETADQAVEDARVAQETADGAVTAAGEAKGIASSANSKADEALRRLDALGL